MHVAQDGGRRVAAVLAFADPSSTGLASLGLCPGYPLYRSHHSRSLPTGAEHSLRWCESGRLRGTQPELLGGDDPRLVDRNHQQLALALGLPEESITLPGRSTAQRFLSWTSVVVVESESLATGLCFGPGGTAVCRPTC